MRDFLAEQMFEMNGLDGWSSSSEAQLETWRTRDGETIRIVDISNSHLENIINYLQTNLSLIHEAELEMRQEGIAVNLENRQRLTMRYQGRIRQMVKEQERRA